MASDRPAAPSQQSLLAGCLLASQAPATEQMLGAMLRDQTGPAMRELSGNVALAASSAPAAPTDTHRTGTLCAGIIGRPRWSDAALSALAADSGQAAALVAAYRAHGEDLLTHLHGPFAFAVVDSASDAALLAIDRLGIQTMAWYSDGPDDGDARLIFGNTVRSVRAHPAVATQIDPQALFDYCFFHVVPAPGSIYRGIRKLQAGQLLTLRDGRVSVRRYWEPVFDADPNADITALEEALRDGLHDAVQRCEPGEHTAAFLSGGLDSSTVCGVASAQLDQPLDAYAMGFAANGYDEMEYARTAARHFGLNLHERYVEPIEIARTLPIVAAWYDEPFGNSSAVPAYLCARTAAADGAQMLLAGDGGDELFAGNERYVKQSLFAHYDALPAWLQKGLIEPITQSLPFRKLPGLKKLSSYVSQARIGMPGRLESYNFLMRTPGTDVFLPEFLASVDPAHPLRTMRDVYERAPSDRMLDKMLYLDWQLTLADNDLRKVSGMCAAAGIEVRYPLLDEELLALSLRVPAEEKIRSRRLRNFYKNALDDFLPREIIQKPKHGFGLPFGVWLKTTPELQEVVYSSLQALKGRDIIVPGFIDELIDTHRDGHASYYGYMLWVLVILENWLAANA